MCLLINYRVWSSSLLAVCLISGLNGCNDDDLQQQNSLISPVIQQRFNQFDSNHDGKITIDELNRPTLFYRVDRNNDGSITLQEARDYLDQRQAARRKPSASTSSDMGMSVASPPVSDSDTALAWASYPAPRYQPLVSDQRPLPDTRNGRMSETISYDAAPRPVPARRLRLARADADADQDAPAGNTPIDTGNTGGVRKFLNLPYATIPGVNPNLLSLDVYAPATGQNHPVIVMVHGGGWQRGDKANTNIATNKYRHFTQAGYVFVSINYRLSPAVKHPAHVQDVAKALAWVAKNINRYSGNPARIYLMGHSAGAHLAALVATDQRYLEAAGENLQLLKGVVLLDGAGYDIPRLMQEHNQPDFYVDAFGNDARIWKDASPVTHITSGKSIPPFLIFYTPRTRSQMLTESLHQSLRSAGIPTRIKMVNKSHAQINREVGQSGDDVTQSIMEFLK